MLRLTVGPVLKCVLALEELASWVVSFANPTSIKGDFGAQNVVTSYCLHAQRNTHCHTGPNQNYCDRVDKNKETPAEISACTSKGSNWRGELRRNQSITIIKVITFWHYSTYVSLSNWSQMYRWGQIQDIQRIKWEKILVMTNGTVCPRKCI